MKTNITHCLLDINDLINICLPFSFSLQFNLNQELVALAEVGFGKFPIVCSYECLYPNFMFFQVIFITKMPMLTAASTIVNSPVLPAGTYDIQFLNFCGFEGSRILLF